MTFQKTSLALLLALPLAATAADSPPPSEPAGFIPGIPVLQAAKDAFLTQPETALSPPNRYRPIATLSDSPEDKYELFKKLLEQAMQKRRIAEHNGGLLPAVSSFTATDTVHKVAIENECSDFIPVHNIEELVVQLYNHMDLPCLQRPQEHHLESLGIPILAYTYNGRLLYKNIDYIDDYNGQFYLSLHQCEITDKLCSIRVEVSKNFFKQGGNIFEDGVIFRHLPSARFCKDYYSKNFENRRNCQRDTYNATSDGIGAFRQGALQNSHAWKKRKSEMIISNWRVPGYGSFEIKFLSSF